MNKEDTRKAVEQAYDDEKLFVFQSRIDRDNDG